MASGRTYVSRSKGKVAATSLADLKLNLQNNESKISLADLPVKNAAEKERLQQQHVAKFDKWFFCLRQQFSLLLYGYGSKRKLLEAFASSTLQDGGVLSISGLFPGLTIKQLLVRVACMIKRAHHSHFRGCSAEGLLEQIQEDKRSAPLYIILHNIEGLHNVGAQPLLSHLAISGLHSGLRGVEAQDLLSHLAACDNIFLVASMDHVNTPLLWDKQVAARFNWLWYDVTNYVPYMLECAHVPSLLVGRRQEATLQSAAAVVQALVPNAQRIFQLLAEEQLEADAQGLTHAKLLRLCQDKFLVSNDVTLRSHLTEFRDHELLQTRRLGDGSEVLFIPMDDNTLKQLLAAGQVD